MTKKLLMFLFFIASSAAIYFGPGFNDCSAISAYPGEYSLSQPSGEAFQANLNGDEFSNWVTKADDNSILIQDADGFWKYAEISFGKLNATDSRAGIDPAPSNPLKNSEWMTNLNTYKENPVIPKTYYADGPASPSASIPLQPTGSSQKILVLLVSFTGKTIQYSDSVWNNQFFGTSGQTVNNFYKENSGGSFSFSPASETYGTANDGIVRVSLNYAHPNPGGSTDDRNRNIVKAALTAADPYINFSSYDTNGNGYIDYNELHIVTITAGYEASCGSTSPSVWGHRWSLGWGSVSSPQLDGKFVAQYPYGGYTQQGEIHSIYGDHLATIGILCHELGHDLGLFDEYNTSNSSDPAVGASSLMCNGSWGMRASDFPGGCPAHLDPWSKIFLGFSSPISASDGTYTVKSATTGQYNILKVSTTDPDQYFLVENRNLSGYDAGLYYDGISDGGVAIWHVDESVISANMSSNTVNNTPAHRGLDIERAVPGSSNSPYYRKSGPNDIFADTTNPNSKLYSGASTGVSIKALDTTGTSMQVLIGNPPGIQFSPSTCSVAENAGSIDLTVSRTGSTAGTLTVDYATGNGTAASGSDYTSATGTLTFAAGETSKTITIPILDDTVYEGNETFTVTLSNVSSGSIIVPSATVTIADNETQPARIAIGPPTVECIGERTFPGTYLYYDCTVTRLGNTSGIVTVDYFTTDGTAKAGQDYLPLSGTITFADGETNKPLRITVYWDGELEDTENFTLGLRNASSGIIQYDKSNIIIEDIDIAFNTLDYSVMENSGNVTLTVKRGISQSSETMSFKYQTIDGTAKAGSDYTAKSGTISFSPGQLSKTITIPVLDDTLYEGDETFTVKLTDVYLTEIKNDVATVTIRDNEVPPLQVGFNSGSYNANENGGSAILTVTRGAYASGALTVNYATANVTAQSGSDYTSTSGTLTFAAGEATKTITVPILDDSIYEGNETFTVTLSNPSAGTITIKTATVIIQDNEVMPTQISISPTSMTFGGEGDGTNGYYDFTVTRSGNTSGTLTVDYSTSDITATAGADYVPLSGTLAFASGETQKKLRVTVLWDGVLEAVESFKLSLSNASSGTIIDSTANIDILDTDIAFDSLSYTAEEDSGNVTLTVNRGPARASLVTAFNYATSNGTAKAGTDYAAGSGTVTFNPGELSKTVTIPILDDNVYEGDETFTVKLTNNFMASAKSPIATITIHDNETPSAQLGFSPASYAVNENGGSVALTVTRSIVTAGVLTVDYATSDGTASDGTDYTAASGTLAFADGETSKTITVPVLDDTLFEGNESFTVTLSNPSAGTLATPTATVAISDNEPAPQISFSPVSYSVSEDGGSISVTINRSMPLSGTVAVDYATVNGSAVAGSDYTSDSGTIIFGDGETSKTVTIGITDDNVHESSEAFRIHLSNPVGGIIMTPDANITINDNDALAPVGAIIEITPYVSSGTVGSCTVGSNQQITIIATFENGGTLDITALAVWNSEYPDVATVSSGLVTGVNAGITVLSFTYEGQTYQFLYTINP